VVNLAAVLLHNVDVLAVLLHHGILFQLLPFFVALPVLGCALAILRALFAPVIVVGDDSTVLLVVVSICPVCHRSLFRACDY
jgi:hypothetical protein